MEFITDRNLQEVNQALRSWATNNSCKVERIINDDPLGGFDERGGIEVRLVGMTRIMEKIWAVAVYVYDQGDSCRVNLDALRVYNGCRISYNESEKKSELIKNQLK